MAGIDFSQPLLGAGASAQTDFAAADARARLDFTGALNFKRGLLLELGIGAFADASAELTKFVHASIQGSAFARANAGIQLQLPLNLFNEFGFTVKAEAIAEAAAGAQADLALSIGDFILLAKRDNDLIGVPLEILLLFLEEVSIGGAFEVNVSASAKAHASLSVSGTIVEKGGDKAGFFFTLDAGAGLAAGVGMGFKAGVEFKDFRRFYGRAVDKTVDATINEIIKILPEDLVIPLTNEPFAPWFEAFAPIAKTALRIAYDVGLKISENNPGNSDLDMKILCDEAVKTFVEESQRFIFHKVLEFGLSEIKNVLEAAHIDPVDWENAISQRTALAEKLLSMSDDPFQATDDNLLYWKDVIGKSIVLYETLSSPDPKILEHICAVYCTYELLMEAVRSKINKATAYASAIGAGTVAANTTPFGGTLNNPPPAELINLITSQTDVTYAHLLQFLINYSVNNTIVTKFPAFANYFKVFNGQFGESENKIIELLLSNGGTFVVSGMASGTVNPQELLELIVDSIDHFLVSTFKTQILPQVLTHVEDTNLRLYIEEVLYEAVLYMKDVGLRSILQWQNKTFNNDDFTESLAGVIMLLLGRTIVITADTFLAAAQENFESSCSKVAGDIRKFAEGNGLEGEIGEIVEVIGDDLMVLVADCVEIGGKVLGPLPPETRRRIRQLLYQIFEPIPVGREQTFLESLGDQFFIPNLEQLQALTGELTNISKDRFIEFVQKFILRIGDYILQKLEELIAFAIDLVVNWERHLGETLLLIAGFLRNLEQTIRDINAELIRLMTLATNALHNFFATLGSNSLRTRIKMDIKDKFVDKAFDALEENDLYKWLPGDVKSTARGLVNGAVDVIMDNPLINPVFEAIAALANQLDDLLPDVRQLDPNDNLPEQLMHLILNRIEANILDHFGGGMPHISPAIDVTFKVWEYYDWDWHLVTHHIHIPLGRIEIDISSFIDIVRDAIDALNFYHNQLNNACFKLGEALAKELELAANNLLHEEKSGEFNRLKKMNDEHNNDPKEIIILTPAKLAHYTSDIDIKIHLGGVPMSYLGFDKGESIRVLIYLNGNLIPSKSLIANETDGDPHSKDFDFRNLIEINKASGKISNAFDTVSGIIKNSNATIMTDTGRQFNSHAKNSERAKATNYAFSNSGLKETTAAKNVYSKIGKGNSAPAANKTFGKDKAGNIVVNHSINNTIPGRKLSPSAMNKLLQESIAGIMIQFKISLDDERITEGVNVLTVVVIEKGGVRHQQNVSFTVSAPVVPKKPVPGIIRKLDPDSGKLVSNIITMNSVFENYKKKSEKDPQYKPTKEAKESLKNYIKTRENKKAAPRKGETVSFTPGKAEALVKKEKLVIRNKEGKEVHTTTISYASLKERQHKLEELKYSSGDLVKNNFKLETREIHYAGNIIERDVITKKEVKTPVIYKPGTVISAVTKEWNEKSGDTKMIRTSHIAEKAVQINSLLPASDKELNRIKETARAYLKMQDALNFREFKKQTEKAK